MPGVNSLMSANTGVAFSMFSGGGALVLCSRSSRCAALVGYFAFHPERPWLWLPTGLLVGGAIGNLIDRVARAR